MSKLDVVIIGGSYAGLSAAMALGRARMQVLVMDNGKPCNAPTPHSHNFLTRDGITPAELALIAKQEVLKYPTIHFAEDTAIALSGENNAFEIGTYSGGKVEARKVVFATGIKDLLPPVEGFADCWGKSVIHCPFCHGYEFADAKTGLYMNNNEAPKFARFLKNWTNDLTVFTSGKSAIDADGNKIMAENGIPVIETNIVKIEHNQGKISRVVFSDGTSCMLDAMYARLPFEQHSNLPVKIGCRVNEQGYIEVDDMQQTTIEGIYAAGDNTSPTRSVANAVAAGNKTGAMIAHALVND